MGSNSKCYLPNDVRPDDLVEAIAFLCGAKREIGTLQGGGVYASVNYAEVSTSPNKDPNGRKVFVTPTHAMGFYIIHIAPTTCDGIWHMGDLFMYPQADRANRFLLYAGVSEFWHEIERALVDFFGGEIDYNDCDSVDVDYKRRKPRKSNCPEDNEEWDAFQRGMLNLPTLFRFVEKL